MKRLKALLTGLALGAVFGAMLDPERRQRAKKALEELKTKVAERSKSLSEVSKEAYEKMVDAAAAEYKDMKTLTREELSRVVKELKDAWVDIAKTLPAKK